MRNLQELGMKPRPRRTVPLEPSNLEAFEKRFGVRLPPEYVQFLKFCNGGRARLRAYRTAAGHVGEVSDFFGLYDPAQDEVARAADPKSWDFGNLWGETRARRSVLGDAAVPIGRDGGGSIYYFDYTKPDAVPVMRLAGDTRDVYEVAPTFPALLDLLQLPDYD